MKDIPSVNLKPLKPYEQKKACMFLCEKAMKEINDDMTFKISYEVFVGRETMDEAKGKVKMIYERETKTLTKYIYTMSIALSFILKLTGIHGFYEYVGSHRQSIVVINTIANLCKYQLLSVCRMHSPDADLSTEQ